MDVVEVEKKRSGKEGGQKVEGGKRLKRRRQWWI